MFSSLRYLTIDTNQKALFKVKMGHLFQIPVAIITFEVIKINPLILENDFQSHSLIPST